MSKCEAGYPLPDDGGACRTCGATTSEACGRRGEVTMALVDALEGCIEHMEWSNGPGREAYYSALAAISKARGES